MACGSNLNINAARKAIGASVARFSSTVCSLPSWLAWTWTGELYCTPSDRFAIRQLQGAVPGEPLWPMPQTLPAGSCIGLAEVFGQTIPLFLAGTDEQLSHFGVGLGNSCDLGISTGTFWSFSWPYDAVAEDPRVRLIPRIFPYPATASLVGYRWGSILEAPRRRAEPESAVLPTSGIPAWAFGDAAKRLHEGMPPSDLVGAVKKDLSMVPTIIGPKVAGMRYAVAYGGGVRWFPDMRLAISSVFSGIEIEFMEQDATLLGLALLASIMAFD